MGNDKNQAVGGLSEDEMESIRTLRGIIQQKTPEVAISNRDAVMYAINNELERQQNDVHTD